MRRYLATAEGGLVMKRATLEQAAKILEVFKGTPLEQIQSILGSGLLTDLRDGDIGRVNRSDFRQLLGLSVADRAGAGSILEFIDILTIPVTAESFVAKDKFVVDTSRKAAVKISYIGDNFKRHFLGKVEKPSGDTVLCRYKLKNNFRDFPIISELGGDQIAETTLASLFGLLRLQSNGQAGALLTKRVTRMYFTFAIPKCFGRCLRSGTGMVGLCMPTLLTIRLLGMLTPRCSPAIPKPLRLFAQKVPSTFGILTLKNFTDLRGSFFMQKFLCVGSGLYSEPEISEI